MYFGRNNRLHKYSAGKERSTRSQFCTKGLGERIKEDHKLSMVVYC